SSMPSTSAAAAASTRSSRDEQYSSSSSSSQFFMNRPITFQPACFRSSAATDESTPPDMPTTTVSDMVVVPYQVEREAPVGQVILHALPDQAAAMTFPACLDLGRRHPQRAQDAGVERPARFMRPKFAGEGKAQISDVPVLARPLVDAGQRGRTEVPCGLLQ